jgi:cell wall-associated NlpC family hydrolase
MHAGVRRTKFVLTCILIAGSLVPAHVAAEPTRADLEKAEARMMELEREFELAVERFNGVEARARRIQLRLARADLEIEELIARVSEERSVAMALANELYRGGASATAEAVLSARSVADVETRLTLLAFSERARVQAFRDLAASLESRASRVDQLDRDRAAMGATMTEANELRADVVGTIREQQAEINRLTALIQQAEARAALAARAAVDATSPLAGIAAHLIKPAPAPNETAQTALDAALDQMGKPYRWGASGPDSFDCSGLTSWAYATAGVTIPRNSAMQYAALPHVDSNDWQPGDLLFFGSPIHHVGMYIGNGQMVHAPFTGTQVRVNLAGRPDLVGAARPAP